MNCPAVCLPSRRPLGPRRVPCLRRNCGPVHIAQHDGGVSERFRQRRANRPTATTLDSSPTQRVALSCCCILCRRATARRSSERRRYTATFWTTEANSLTTLWEHHVWPMCSGFAMRNRVWSSRRHRHRALLDPDGYAVPLVLKAMDGKRLHRTHGIALGSHTRKSSSCTAAGAMMPNC